MKGRVGVASSRVIFSENNKSNLSLCAPIYLSFVYASRSKFSSPAFIFLFANKGSSAANRNRTLLWERKPQCRLPCEIKDSWFRSDVGRCLVRPCPFDSTSFTDGATRPYNTARHFHFLFHTRRRTLCIFGGTLLAVRDVARSKQLLWSITVYRSGGFPGRAEGDKRANTSYIGVTDNSQPNPPSPSLRHDNPILSISYFFFYFFRCWMVQIIRGKHSGWQVRQYVINVSHPPPNCEI